MLGSKIFPNNPLELLHTADFSNRHISNLTGLSKSTLNKNSHNYNPTNKTHSILLKLVRSMLMAHTPETDFHRALQQVYLLQLQVWNDRNAEKSKQLRDKRKKKQLPRPRSSSDQALPNTNHPDTEPHNRPGETDQ